MNRLPRFMGGAFDARGNGQFLAEVAMQRYGASRIQQVMLSEGWYREHMPPVKAALEDGELGPAQGRRRAGRPARRPGDQGRAAHPRHPHHGRGQGQRHGDVAVAVALAYYASRELNKGLVTVKSRRRRAAARITQGYQ